MQKLGFQVFVSSCFFQARTLQGFGNLWHRVGEGVREVVITIIARKKEVIIY